MRKTQRITKRQTHKKAVDEYKKADTVNYEGFPAFTPATPLQCLQMAMTGTVEDTFYVSAEETYDKSAQLYKAMLADPANAELLAKIAVFSRTRGFMRLQPTIILSALTTLKDKTLARKVAAKILSTPKDALSFAELCRSGTFREGLGFIGKQIISDYLVNHISQYYGVKYPTELRDLIRLSHPKTSGWSAEKNAIASYAVGSEYAKDLLPQIAALETLKTKPDPQLAIQLIDQYRLPHETVTSVAKMDDATWKAVAKSMPVFALTRHLVTLKGHNAFDDKATLDTIVAKLEDPHVIQSSRMFPHSFWQAYKMLADEGGAALSRVKLALAKALELSVRNIPTVSGRGAVILDVSGSMYGAHGNSVITPVEIGAVFAHALAKLGADVSIYPVDTRLHQVVKPKPYAIDTIAALHGMGGGGTDFALAIKHFRETHKVFDWILIITDGEEWCTSTAGYGYGQSYGALPELKLYWKQINPKTKVVSIRIDPYVDKNPLPELPQTTFVSGWSDVVVDFTARFLNGNLYPIDEVAKVEL